MLEMMEEKVQVAVVVLMACGYGVVMSRLDFSLRVGGVVTWEKNDSSIEMQGAQGAVVVVVRIAVSRVGSSVVCEEGGSCVGGGREFAIRGIRVQRSRGRAECGAPTRYLAPPQMEFSTNVPQIRHTWCKGDPTKVF